MVYPPPYPISSTLELILANLPDFLHKVATGVQKLLIAPTSIYYSAYRGALLTPNNIVEPAHVSLGG
jgi:hypothetical protein